MMVNGLSPGVITQEVQVTSAEKQQIDEEIRQQEAQVKEEEKSDTEKRGETSKLVMNDYQLRELLFIMSSRGNSATVEKLAQLLKKEKDLLTIKHHP